MSTPSWAISRRTMLRGLGVAVALPMLDIMAPSGAFADEPEAVAGPRFKPPRTPVRAMLLNLPCGTYRKEWGVDQPGPIGTLKPVSSASGMNWSGGIIPLCGWRQRSSASAPMILPVVMSTFGW